MVKKSKGKTSAEAVERLSGLLKQVEAEPVGPELKELALELEKRLREEHPDIELRKEREKE